MSNLNDILSGIKTGLNKSGAGMGDVAKYINTLARHASEHNDWTVMNKPLELFRTHDQEYRTSLTAGYLQWGKLLGLIVPDGEKTFLAWSGVDAFTEGYKSAKSINFWSVKKPKSDAVEFDIFAKLETILKSTSKLGGQVMRAEALGAEVDVNCPDAVVDVLRDLVARGRRGEFIELKEAS